MKKKTDAIGTNMTNQRVEYFRELKYLGLLVNDDLSRKVVEPVDEKIKARSYYMYSKGEPLTYIEEFFSSNLIPYMRN
jgi:chorismate-pyruvate lyase